MISDKFRSVWARLAYIIYMLPTRIKRFLIHLVLPLGLYKNEPQALIINSVMDWLVGFILYFLDIFGIPELYEIIFECTKWNIRDLNAEEKNLTKVIFGKTIDSALIRLDEKAILGPKQYHFAYVSFHTINSYGKLRKPIFVHEIVHVWQYHLLGSIYTYKALRAQHSKAGYGYGGFRRLYFAFEKRKSLLSFNFEQQAEIIMHAFEYQGKVAKKQVQRDELKEQVYGFYMDQVVHDDGYAYALAQLDGANGRIV